jgi:septal ring factor EnvC (AmiA/AmiB activator)
MDYKGKLYGRLSHKRLFEIGYTAEDVENLIKKISELESKIIELNQILKRRRKSAENSKPLINKSMSSKPTREMILNDSVEMMKKFGYTEVTLENILAEEKYCRFLKYMLNVNLGRDKQIDLVINEILSEIE